MRKHLTAAFLLVVTSFAFASERMPGFGDYPVAEIFRGKNAKLKTKFDDSDQLMYALKQAMSNPVNFAGHYIVFRYPCGGGCITGAVLDAITGEYVEGFPKVYSVGDDADSFDTFFKINSSLMIITGIDAENFENSRIQTDFYNFENGKFKLLKTKKGPYSKKQ